MFEDLVDVYKEQAKIIAEAGADLFVVETMMSLQNSQQEWEKLKAQTGAYRAKCRAILTSQLRLLDDMAADGEGKENDNMASSVSVSEKSAQPVRPDQGRQDSGKKDAPKSK